jgi:serine/threonine-protein kinase
MGIVLAATHVHLRQRVAIKLLRPEAAARRGAVERFLREARVAMSLRGEHVIRIFDVGTLDDGQPFIAMECLEGRDFGALLDAAAPLAPAVAVDYVLQAIEAVAEAHALGVVHRDLKPANLFLTKRVDGSPCVKVLDFGVSKVAEDVAADELEETGASSTHDGELRAAPPEPVAVRARITRASALVGSPRYMAPEQIDAPSDVDARADVWALGVILFELLTGAPPFDGHTLEELCASVTSTPAPRLPGVPGPLEAAVRRCLAKEPGKRFPSVHALAEALAPFASADGPVIAARIGRIVGAGGTASDTPIVRDLGGKHPRPGRARVTVLAAVAVACAAGIALGVAMTASPRPPDARPSSGVVVPPASASSLLATSPPSTSTPAAPPVPSTPSPGPAASVAAGSRAGVRTFPVASSPPVVAPSSTAAPPPAVDPLHLDAGFLFRDRK